MTKTKIRLEVLNISLTAWKKVERIAFNGYEIEVTPKELMDLIGFDGGQFLSRKLNDSERAFVDEYYRYGNELLEQAKPTDQ